MIDVQIDNGLAVAIAGQVAVGLTPGDGSEARKEAALQAIGLMVLNAVRGEGGDVSQVQGVLDSSANASVTIEGGTISVSFPSGETATVQDGQNIEPGP